MMRPFRLQSIQGLRHAQLRFSRQAALASVNYQARKSPRCRWSSTESSGTPSEKPYYITTPIFYVNAAPHIGHLYNMVLTDVLKRWQKLQGKEAYLCTGTDEHGMKIQRAAAKEGIPPKEFCDANSQKFKDLAEEANISNDFFIRTTDEDHKRAVEEFWLHLKNGLPGDLGLYKGSHAGWYCVSDECFYPEDMVQPSVVPHSGRKIMSSIETGNEVEWVEEDTWIFPLTKYKDQLLRFYDENPDWITPSQKMNEVRAWVENHLEDLSITRPASRLSWGIPDPEDKSNTIYVWVDALINYMTKAGYPSKWQVSSKDKGIWPADVHVVGKDIIRFHAVYWPAMLMALGLPLPKRILCHNHWTMSNRKMSKSLGNVVDPVQAIQRWDIDPLRYFLMRNGNFKGDMSYSNDLVMTVYEKDLAANIGNLFNRISKARGNRWSTKEAVQAASNGDFKDISQILQQRSTKPVNLDPKVLQKSIEQAVPEFKGFMNELLPNRALGVTFDLLSETNRFISDVEPWSLVKETSPESRTILNWTIYNCAEALRIAGLLLQPVMPEKASDLLNGLGVSPERRSLEWAEYGRDMEYGTVATKEKIGPKLARWISLFPPVAGMDAHTEAVASGDAYASVSPRKRMNMIVESLANEAAAKKKA